MKLAEILRIPYDPHFKNKKPKVTDSKQIGTFDRIPIYQGTIEGYPDLYCLEIKDEAHDAAFKVYQVISLHGVKYANVLKAWVDQAKQNQGWASRLYTYVTKELRLPVLSDEEQTPEAELLYRSFLRTKKTKILNIVTGETFDSGTFDLAKIYSNSEINGLIDYRIVLEERKLTLIDDICPRS